MKLYTCPVCSEITPQRYCPRHQPSPNGHRSPNRDSAAQSRFRKAVLERDHYCCVLCGATDRPLVAAHLKPLRDFAKNDPAAYDPVHGRTLCEDCDVATDRYATRRPTLDAKTGSLVVIVGTPGSGKTTLARRLRDDHGYVHLEADAIRLTITGSPTKWSPLVWAQMGDRGRTALQSRDVVIDSTGTSPSWPALVTELAIVASTTLVVCLQGSEAAARARGAELRSGDHQRIAGIVGRLEADERLQTDALTAQQVYNVIRPCLQPSRMA